MASIFKFAVMPLVSSITIQKTNFVIQKDLDQGTVQDPAPRSNYSAMAWSSLVHQLQGDYSKALYRNHDQVDEKLVNIIWLPLLDTSTLGLLTEIGVCLRGPSFASQTLPLHAPHSPTSPGASVWRHTELKGIESYGWVEVTHTAIKKEYASGALPWFYVAHGSGVSLNVGRTVVLDETRSERRCKRGAPTDALGLPSCMSEGLNLSALDSIQLIHAFDPGWDDTVGISPKQGFRHEILLLTHDLISENENLYSAVNRVATNPQLTVDINRVVEPALMCGRWPRLFQCDHDYPPLKYMSGSHGGVCSKDEWRAMMWHCDRNFERVRDTNDCNACPDSSPHDCAAW